MKNVLISNADTKGFTANGQAALSMSTSELTKQAVLAIDELSTVYGHRTNYVVRGIAWAIKSELNKMVRQADNTIATSMALAIKDADSERIRKMSSAVTSVADWAEELFKQYQGHAQVLSTLGDYVFELHPFQRAIEATFEVNNDLDDGFLEDGELNDLADLGFYEEDDEAAEWLAENELVHDMQQHDLRKQKVNLTQAMDSERKVVYEDVSKEEWIDDRLHRTPDEWTQGAQYGAWAIMKQLRGKAIADKNYGLVVEHIGDMPEKSIPFATKCMRKAIDFSNKIERLEGRKQYVLDQIHKMDNTSEELTIAAMSNAVRDDEVTEVDKLLRETRIVHAYLEHYAAEFRKLLDLVELDTPVRVYSSYMTFDPIEFLVAQMVKKAGYTGTRVSPRKQAEFQADAYRLLGNPTTIESFTTDDGVEFWGVHFTQGSEKKLAEAAKEISKVRAIQYRQDELAARAAKLEKLTKSTAMRNKKPTSPLELEAITNKFLF